MKSTQHTAVAMTSPPNIPQRQTPKPSLQVTKLMVNCSNGQVNQPCQCWGRQQQDYEKWQQLSPSNTTKGPPCLTGVATPSMSGQDLQSTGVSMAMISHPFLPSSKLHHVATPNIQECAYRSVSCLIRDQHPLPCVVLLTHSKGKTSPIVFQPRYHSTLFLASNNCACGGY